MFPIKVYLLNTTSIDPASEKLLSVISEERKRRAQGYVKVQAVQNSYGAELLLRYALKEAGISPNAQILVGANGKPYMANGELEFSLSHSGNYAVCAVSDSPVGVDIERIKELKPSLCKRILRDDDEIKDPIRAWTAKEAYLKLIGEGLCGNYALHDLHLAKDTVTCMKTNRKARVVFEVFGEYVVAALRW